MPPKTEELVEIGFIRGAHGLKGHVVIHAHSQNANSLIAYGPLTNATATRDFDIAVISENGKDFLCSITGVTERNGAEALRGTVLYTLAKNLPQTEENEYYIKDLIGCSTVTHEGIVLGEIVNVLPLGNHDALEIRFVHDGTAALPAPQTELLLFTAQNVGDVDLKGRRVVITLPHGLLDTPEKDA